MLGVPDQLPQVYLLSEMLATQVRLELHLANAFAAASAAVCSMHGACSRPRRCCCCCCCCCCVLHAWRRAGSAGAGLCWLYCKSHLALAFAGCTALLDAQGVLVHPALCARAPLALGAWVPWHVLPWHCAVHWVHVCSLGTALCTRAPLALGAWVPWHVLPWRWVHVCSLGTAHVHACSLGPGCVAPAPQACRR